MTTDLYKWLLQIIFKEDQESMQDYKAVKKGKENHMSPTHECTQYYMATGKQKLE